MWDRGFPSCCSMIPMRILNGPRSWPTRCRWPPWYYSSGCPRLSGRSSCCGRCSGSTSPRSPRRLGGRRRRAVSSRCGPRRHVDAGRPRFEADRRARDQLAARFFDALRSGDVDGLRKLLAADVELAADGGGKAPALTRRPTAPRRGSRRRWPARRQAVRGPTRGASSRPTRGVRCVPSRGRAP